MNQNKPKMNEAVSVKKSNYSWGKMVTVHHGADTSYPLHPEHQAAIKKLKPGESTSFTDETNRKVTASREGDQVHLSGRGSNKKTTVAHSHFAEGNMSLFKQFRAQLEEKTLTPAEKKKREEVAKAIERENPNMPMGMKMAIATKTAKRVAEEVELDEADKKQKALSRALNKLPRKPDTEYDRKVTSYLKKKYNKEEVEFANLDESVKTTHEDPLVTVHDKDGLHTHANLSTANHIFNTNVKHTDVHKGPVSVTSGHEDKRKLKFAISMHHAQAVKDEEKFKKEYGESVEDQHLCAKHVRSSLLGDGIVLEAQHSDPDEEGNIEWYMVEFKSGIRKVYTEDLEIMIAEYHGNHKKKRMTNG